MTTFDEREQAFENKFQHDEELQFKVLARRARLLGLWAAERLGHRGEAAQAYARELIDTDLVPQGERVLVDRVHQDLLAKGDDISLHRVERRAAELLAEARRQYMEG
jgi:hypothetical protein